MTYEKVIENNDWGRLTYTAGSKKLDPKDTNTVHVKLPRLALSCAYEVSWKPCSERVCDMGNYYTVNSHRPYITIDHYGALIEVPLAGLEIAVL